MNLPTRFETRRLILRCYQPGDGRMFFAVSQKNQAHLARYEADNVLMALKSEEDAEAAVCDLAAGWSTGNYYFIGAFDKNTSEFVAQVYVGLVNRELPEYQIGYIADVEHEGQGYVTEAVQAVLGLIFETLKAHRLRLKCDDTNVRSYRVAERCGFVREGHLRENHRHPDGAITGTFIYGLLGSEYEQRKRTAR